MSLRASSDGGSAFVGTSSAIRGDVIGGVVRTGVVTYRDGPQISNKFEKCEDADPSAEISAKLPIREEWTSRCSFRGDRKRLKMRGGVAPVSLHLGFLLQVVLK